MLSGWCDIRHNHKEDDRQTRAARIHCEDPATSSNYPVRIEFNLNPVKRTFDEKLWRDYRRRLRMDRVALFVTPPAVAETVTEVLDEPGDVVTMNVAELPPAAIVTLAGTLATEGLLLDSPTTVPPAGAGPLRVTVPVEELPAFTVEGESVNDDSTGGLMVTAVVLVTPA